MTDRTLEFSPQRYARICGLLYLYLIAAGLSAEVLVRSRLIVPGDAAATAANILANQSLFRLGFAGEFLQLAFDVVIAVILYALLKPVDRNIALLAALMRLACDVVLAVAGFAQFAALRLLSGADYLRAFEPGELQALALLALKLHGDGYAVCLVFFGFACLALGYLVYRSTYLPRFLGVLLAIAGACYLVNSFAGFLAPALAASLMPMILMPCLVAELALALWLLVRGVDLAKWHARTGTAAAPAG